MLEQLEITAMGRARPGTLLTQLEDVQAMHIAHRDRLNHELAQCQR